MGKIHFHNSNFQFLKTVGVLNDGESEIEVSELILRTFRQDKLAQVTRSLAVEAEFINAAVAFGEDYLNEAKIAAEQIQDRKTLSAALEKFTLAQNQVSELTKQTLVIAECLDGFKTELAKQPQKSYGRYSEIVKTYLSTIEEFAPYLVADADAKIRQVKAIRAIIEGKQRELLS